jgi:metal transporter CNNM
MIGCNLNSSVCCEFVTNTSIECYNRTFVIETPLDAPGTSAFGVDLGVCLALLSGIALIHGINVAILSIDQSNCEILIRSRVAESPLAANVLPLVKRRVWLLISMLLVRVACAESLPIFVNHMLSPALSIVASAIAVTFLGDLFPALIFARRRLQYASFFRYLMWFVMFATGIVSYPLSKLIEPIAGDGDQGMVWSRGTLKELIGMQAAENSANSRVDGYGDDADDDMLTLEEAFCIQGALDLSNTDVAAKMTPIDEITMIEEHELVTSELVGKLLASGFSRIPVFRRDRAHIIGFILVRDILTLGGHASPVDSLRLRRLPHVPSDTGCFEMLQRFKQGQSHMALVVASDLVTPVGIVTLVNILELLLGSIADEADHDTASGIGPPRMLARNLSRRPGHAPPSIGHISDAAMTSTTRLGALVTSHRASRRAARHVTIAPVPHVIEESGESGSINDDSPRQRASSSSSTAGNDERESLLGSRH